MSVQIEHIRKEYRTQTEAVRALDDVSFTVNTGEFLVVRGPSGSGKTTLLLTLGGMLQPSSGRILVDGTDLYALPSQDRARFRAGHIGFVFQTFQLIPYLTVLENVLLPAGPGGRSATRTEAATILETMRLGHRLHHVPGALSAGEQQRAAVARALIGRPTVVLADEPTGNLDPENGAAVIAHLAAFRQAGGTVVVVTHGEGATPHADRIVELHNGTLTPANRPLST